MLAGEARRGGLTMELPEAVADVRVRQARLPGRPIILIDPGHGGRDPGATGVSGSTLEKDLALVMATELADLLEERGRVRVALTREKDPGRHGQNVRAGRVNAELLKEIIPDPSSCIVYACGPAITKWDRLLAKEKNETPQPRFMESALELLQQIGVSDDRIKRESYG